MAKYPKDRDEWKTFEVERNDHELLIGGWQVMTDWELPIMQKLAQSVSGKGKDVLEIGFGMGISANAIIELGCKSYTVIEAHPEVAENARQWLSTKNCKFTVIEAFWQDVIDDMPSNKYDGILFDTYPLAPDERGQAVYPFIPKAKRLLTENGVFTYYSGERSDFRANHIELLLQNYKTILLERVSNFIPPEDCEYWHDDYMIIPTVSNPIFEEDTKKEKAGFVGI